MSETVELRKGLITSIRQQAKAPDRVSLFIDGAFAFGIHRDILLEFDLRKGIELEVETQQAILRRDAFFKARATAFKYLSFRGRTASEVRRRLARSDYQEDVSSEVVAYLERLGLLDDEAYARRYAESRYQAGGYGPTRIRIDLHKKGIPAATARAAIEEVFSERSEVVERARELGRKRWNRLVSEPDARKRRKKVYDYLARRGFGFDIVHQVVGDLNREST